MLKGENFNEVIKDVKARMIQIQKFIMRHRTRGENADMERQISNKAYTMRVREE